MIASELEAKEVVNTWLKENGGSFRYEHLSVKRDARGWVVLLAVFAKEGYELDGPYVLLVDAASGSVSTSYP